MKLSFLYFALLAIAIPPHAGNSAYFNIHLDKNPAELVLEMESNYLGYIFNSSAEGVNGELAANEYLNKHFTIYFNNKPCLLNVCSIEPDNFGHIFIKAEILNEENTNVNTIRIKNTSFLNDVDEQVNVIMIYQKEKEKEMRGFKMTKERKEIEFEL